MFYTTELNDHGLKYNPFKAIVAPRPIAWISTIDKEGRSNLAPYSFFNGMQDSPPIIGFGSGPSKIGIDEPKDSLSNIEATGNFCVSIVSEALKNQMNISSGHFPHNENEYEIAVLTQTLVVTVSSPFVTVSPVSLACKLLYIISLP